MVRFLFIVLFVGGFAIPSFSADSGGSRKEYPLQIQAILPWGGAFLGYHVNENVMFGISTQAGAGIRSTDENNDGKPDNDKESRILDEQPEGISDSSYNQGRSSTYQLRWSPSNNSGFFVAFGGYNDNGETERLQLDSRTRVIGNNTYENTDLKIILKRYPIWAPLLGIGWNWILDSGYSFGFDATTGLYNEYSTRLEVVTSTSNTAVTEEDLRLEEEKMISGSNFGAGHINLIIGINF
ncbi:MAG: hypothetical protein HQM11_07965 [SAR324 cluster bacterium]|nr:hypothetical protein [SAR324 cluster bacterium]